MNNEILLAQPRGFCAGVHRAIEIVERALTQFGAPIYVRHEIVHNTYVVESLRRKGAVFIEEIEDVPDGSTLIFSAHGVPKSVRAEAEKRGLKIFDATCPLVTKVHMEVAKMRREGREIVMIGHAGHPEVIGTMGQVEDGMYLIQNVNDVQSLDVRNPDMLSYVSQTTLSVGETADVIAALKQRFPLISEPKKADICYATTNRQEAVKALLPQVDLVIVVGSRNSSNSNRLREVAQKNGKPAYMVDNASQINPSWIKGCTSIGVTAGASAPEILVREVIDRLETLGIHNVRELDGVRESTLFPMPKGLGSASS